MSGVKVGIQMANAIIDFCHLMYQKDTAKRVLEALIKRLKSRIGEFERR